MKPSAPDQAQPASAENQTVASMLRLLRVIKWSSVAATVGILLLVFAWSAYEGGSPATLSADLHVVGAAMALFFYWPVAVLGGVVALLAWLGLGMRWHAVRGSVPERDGRRMLLGVTMAVLGFMLVAPQVFVGTGQILGAMSDLGEVGGYSPGKVFLHRYTPFVFAGLIIYFTAVHYLKRTIRRLQIAPVASPSRQRS